MDYDTDEALDTFVSEMDDDFGGYIEAQMSDWADENAPSGASSPLESLITQMLEEYNKGQGMGLLGQAFSEYKGKLTEALNDLSKKIKPLLEKHAETMDEGDEEEAES